MTHRIPTWMAVIASGVLASASALAQSGGDNPRPSGDQAAGAHPSEPARQSAGGDTGPKVKQAQGKSMKDKHASGKHGKDKMNRDARMSGSGTAAAGGSALRSEMSRCTAMTDRDARAECAREAWESHGPNPS